MKPIEIESVQEELNKKLQKKVYVHLETTTGAYSAHFNENNMTVVAFIRNVEVSFSQAKIKGEGPYRVGLKLEHGWVYAEGLTDWTVTDQNQLLLAGHDKDGKLAIALQISEVPFSN
ncbi:YojF family protein [Metabacillus arenae]|uniref:YojF family protein n=1 Tax=Metabacillus arenae TaxID=2771434 RepID=A0A926RZG3_9BACI|nr:YojF family protein [Metabacillus arenae]MBD1379024.1 YojF family protein [Metabacillus arenae]